MKVIIFPNNHLRLDFFFMADDYIRFLSDMKVYLQKDLEFINPKDSKWADRQELKGDPRFGAYPVARISNGDENIEIFFLHYHSEKEAQEKWARRIERINWNRLIVKFNDQNGCETEHLEKFLDFDYPNKLFFTCKHWDNIRNENVIYIRQPFFYKTITASHEPFGENKHININEYINNL